MEELYSETYLHAKPSIGRRMARIGLIVLSILIALAAFFVFSAYLGPFGVLFAVVADSLIIYFLPSNKIAYEYIFVDGQIDFDMIINGNKRKRKKRIDMDKVELVAPETSHALHNYENLPLRDFSSGNPEDKHFIAVTRTENNQERIKFTPDEKMLELIKLKGRNKIQY